MKNQHVFLTLVITALAPYKLAAQGYSQNLVQNGSFEVNYSYSGWTLAGGTLVNLGGPGAGVQCADGFNAIGLGWQASVYQDVPTVVGQLYDLSFYMANWDANSVPANVVSLIVSFGGSSVGSPTFSGAGHTYQSMGWQRFDYTVTATSTESRIMFFNPALVNSDTGFAMIDNASLVSIPEPTAGELLTMSGIIAFLRCRRTFALHSTPRPRSFLHAEGQSRGASDRGC
jgi:hypothetical protein